MCFVCRMEMIRLDPIIFSVETRILFGDFPHIFTGGTAPKALRFQDASGLHSVSVSSASLRLG